MILSKKLYIYIYVCARIISKYILPDDSPILKLYVNSYEYKNQYKNQW